MSISYPTTTTQSTTTSNPFSLLARAFAFCPGARFTGLLDPAFFQSHAHHHRLSFGAGQGDTFDPAVTRCPART